MAQEHGEGRSSGGSEAERRQDGGGEKAALPPSEAARGNVEPEVETETPAIPPATIDGNDGRPIAVQEDNGVAWAEVEDKV